MVLNLKKKPLKRGFYKNKSLATTYSPTSNGSTIGAIGLNFSVRNGKRWTPMQ
jgi:hypothetical protein